MCAGSSVDGQNFELEEQLISTKPDKFATHYHRLEYLGDVFMDFVDTVFPELVVFEGYARNKKQGREESGELGGHIRLRIVKAGIPFIIVPPTVLKKFVTGKGNGKKDLMMMHAYKKWGYEAANDDACDAYGLMRLGWYHPRKTKTMSVQKILESCEVVGG